VIDGKEVVRSPEQAPEQGSSKESYEPPKLAKLGDVRTTVLGATPGLGDSPANRA